MANPDLHPGESSEWVLYLQQMVNHHYQQSVVPESGEFDETTANAVSHFRDQNGLGEGSTVDSAVWDKLGAKASAPGPAPAANPGPAADPRPAADKEAASTSTDRGLTSDEVAAAYSVFHNTLDTGSIVLSEGGVLAIGGYARTLPDHVTFPAGTLTNPPSGFMRWLIHELGHCWQYQQGASVPGLIVSAIGADYDYGGEQGLRDAVANGQPFAEFGYEEQASILADYYARIGGDTSAYDPYIKTVRDGTWESAPAKP